MHPYEFMKAQLLFKPTHWWTAPLLIAGIVATSAIVTYAIISNRAEGQNPTVAPAVAKPTPIPSVAALGYIQPQGEAIFISAPSATPNGVTVKQLSVKQGDKVKIGQIIAILDNRDRLTAALQQAEKQVSVAEANLAQVKAGAKTGDILAQKAKYQGSKAELDGQIATQRSTIANIEAQLQGERMAQKATISRLEAELNNAKVDCQRYQYLNSNGGISTQERDRVCLQVKTNQQFIEEAEANLQRIITSRNEQIQEAKANLQRTIATQKQQIEEAAASLDAVSQVRPVDVQVAEADLEVAKAAVVQAKADLDLAYIRAPRNGQILKINTWEGEIVGDKGIVTLGQTQQMYVTAQVYESDIPRIRLGQKATIQAGESIGILQGTVSEIGLEIGRKDVLGTDPVADVDARVVEVKIRLTPKDSQRVSEFTNLQVKAIIDVGNSEQTTTNLSPFGKLTAAPNPSPARKEENQKQQITNKQ